MTKRLLEIEARLLNARVDFRRSHDIAGFELSCCAKSRELFETLRAFESEVRRLTTREAP